MATHAEYAMNLLRQIESPTQAVKATMAVAHAQLAVSDAVAANTAAVKAQTAKMVELWNAPSG